jgi:membrane protease YdiL (CAAX protease family)
MTIKKASLFLFSLYLTMFLFNEAMSLVKPSLEPITGMGYMMINKTIFAIGLLILVYGLRLQRQCGLVFKANWRTLPLYWPMALIAGLSLFGGINTDTSGSMLVIIFVTVVVGSFGEELMFRGLVFHWFRDLSVRKQILISAFAFGGLHLLGVGIAYEIILAQVYFAAGLGLVWGYARSQDYSIMIPIMIHVIFNLIVLGSKGGIVEAVSVAPIEQVVIGMLTVGSIGWAWGGFLLWKAGKKSDLAAPLSSISTI